MGRLTGSGWGKVGLFFEIPGDFVKTTVVVELVGLSTGKLCAFKSPPVGLVVAKDPIAWSSFFALELGEEAHSVDGIFFSQFDPGGLGEGGIEIGEIDEIIGDEALGAFALP